LALEIYQNGVGDNSNNIALVYFNMGTLYGKQGKNKQAIKFKKNALNIWKTILPDRHPNLEAVKNEIYHLRQNR
jgi:tetratricopeptide (TPR) repeat protein